MDSLNQVVKGAELHRVVWQKEEYREADFGELFFCCLFQLLNTIQIPLLYFILILQKYHSVGY